MSASEFTHLDPLGRARMVDVTRQGGHPPPGRRPVPGVHGARDRVARSPPGAITKGDVLAVARVAGIQAAKQTPEPDPAVPPAAGGLGAT